HLPRPARIATLLEHSPAMGKAMHSVLSSQGCAMKRVLGTGIFLLLMGTMLAFAQDKKDKDKDKDKEKDTYDTVLKQMLDIITRARGTLAKVKADETAKTARPELEKIGQEMADVQQRSLKLGKPSEEQSKALEKKYGEQLRNAVKDLDEQALR